MKIHLNGRGMVVATALTPEESCELISLWGRQKSPTVAEPKVATKNKRRKTAIRECPECGKHTRGLKIHMKMAHNIDIPSLATY